MSHLIPIRLPISLSRRFRNPCFLSQMRSRVSTCDSRSGYHGFLSQTRSRVSTCTSRSGFHSSVRHFHGTKKSEPNQFLFFEGLWSVHLPSSQTRSRVSTCASRSGFHSSVRHFHGTKKSEPNQASVAYIFHPNGNFPIKPAGQKAFRVIKGKAEK
ncbi:uncharacterized protein LOC110878776 [Helianthus annuus]|uniref:uncharacterized protein LOC110878776 n=1 Tax=Helianthus annuus TaxID=4232 RepID=UPI000B9092BE|nr:uncharacterized protein LOC110878776 [Helianthus annuus]